MTKNEILSFVIPSRNNLEYLKIAYKSIRDNSKEKHWICFADDCSNDGTRQWLKEIKAKDNRVKYLINADKHRIGHTYLYDKIIEELVDTDIFVIWHADMYMLPGADLEFMVKTEPKQLLSLTRIEPPLHPSGPEKIQMNFGVDAKSFNEQRILSWYEKQREKGHGHTEGIFAPWSCYKSTFQEIGGHDWLFIPQSKEDSDIFNRFKLYGCKFIQTWSAYCYHFTSRGSRFNSHITSIGKNSHEWNRQNRRSTRNFIRKWGSMVKHTSTMEPIVTKKRDIGIIIRKPDLNYIGELEPYCNNMLVTGEKAGVFARGYLNIENENTLLNIENKFVDNKELTNDVIIDFNGETIDELKEVVYFLENFDYIINDRKEFARPSFTVKIINDKGYEKENIYLNNKEKYKNKYSNLKIKVYN